MTETEKMLRDELRRSVLREDRWRPTASYVFACSIGGLIGSLASAAAFWIFGIYHVVPVSMCLAAASLTAAVAAVAIARIRGEWTRLW